MIKVALIGANGKVGAEVAIYLSMRSDVDLLCLIRSEYGAALLQLASIKYKVVDYADGNALEQLLGDRDVVVDFTYPTGQSTDFWEILKRHITSVMQTIKPGSTYIYMSSIMAFGMPPGYHYVRNFLLSGTSYSYIKRKSERFVRKLGKELNLKVFTLRLSQIHGSLQPVTQQFINDLSSSALCVNGKPESLTNTAFTFSVSEAIIKCAKGNLTSGLYTVVSSPQWTLEELLQYYKDKHGGRAQVYYVGNPDDAPPYRSLLLGHAKSKLLSFRD